MKTLLYICGSCLTCTALAQSEVQLRPSLQWYTVGESQTLASSNANPKNAIELSDRTAAIDLRPSLKLDIDKFQLIARPQLRSEVSSANVEDRRRAEHPHSSSKWIEAYGAWTASNELMLAFGIQNYQWGAAESLNPSNRIFHETVDSKGLLYTVQGRQIMRLNYTWSKNITSVLMAETEPVKDALPYQAEEVFQTKSLMKHEVNWNSGADYFGLVLGAAETDGPWVGEYFSQTLFDGLSLYADASHERGSNAWYPVEESSTLILGATAVQMRQAKIDEAKVQTLAVAGLRYSFEGGSDLRGEYVVNTAGWDKNETELAKKSLDLSQVVQQPDYKTNAARWLKPGLEFRGRQYGLLSLRLPDFIEIKDLTVYLRTLRSLQDRSASYYTSIEYGFGTASTLLLSGMATSGKQDDELRGLVAASTLVGLRQDF